MGSPLSGEVARRVSINALYNVRINGFFFCARDGRICHGHGCEVDLIGFV